MTETQRRLLSELSEDGAAELGGTVRISVEALGFLLSRGWINQRSEVTPAGLAALANEGETWASDRGTAPPAMGADENARLK